MSTPDGEQRAGAGPDRRRAAPLVAAAVLAVLAGAAVLFADDARWLRLAVVAALWASLLAAVVIARRARTETALAEQAREAADELAAAEEDAQERIAALEDDRDRMLAQEVAAREEAEQSAERAREDAASLREELERARSEEAVTLQGVGLRMPAPPRGTGLRVVDSGPQPGFPPVPPPAQRHPSMPGTPAQRVPSPAAAAPAPVRPVHPTPMPPPEVPQADPAVLAAGSFVDQYVRSAGYQRPEPPADEPRSRRAPAESATTGRTVAELLAAHAASGGTVGRRRRDP
jgi:hypothetical protein